jgi:D-serine dehydratase
MNTESAESGPLDWRMKGLPRRAEGLRPEELGRAGLGLLDGDLMLPVAILRHSSLQNNRDWMKAFLAMTGVKLCPHGKTTMSPEIFRMQAEDGAWGMTAATAHHVRVYRQLGIRRIMLANQLIGRANIEYVLEALASDPEFDFYCLVDSLDAVQILVEAFAERVQRPLQVLLELGAYKGRTGVRTFEEGMRVARAIAATSCLRLRGIETFEGIIQAGPDVAGDVDRLLGATMELATECERASLFSEGSILLTAGGSAWFDRCAKLLSSNALLTRTEVILRSGCYIAHDHGMCAKSFEGLQRRRADVARLGAGLRPALEVWAYVQSVPESDRAIVACGKRDVSYDDSLPLPLWWYRSKTHDRPQPMPAGFRLSALNDQHAYLDGPAELLAVGDFIGFGISHPCTTFDKWRLLPVVDDDYRIVSAVTTLF